MPDHNMGQRIRGLTAGCLKNFNYGDFQVYMKIEESVEELCYTHHPAPRTISIVLFDFFLTH